MTEYILKDRLTGTNYSVQIDDGQLKYTDTTKSVQAEPIIQDLTNPTDYWRLFISDGELAIETSSVQGNDFFLLNDITTGIIWRIFVEDGQLSYSTVIKSYIGKPIILLSRITKLLNIQSLMEKQIFEESQIEKHIVLESSLK